MEPSWLFASATSASAKTADYSCAFGVGTAGNIPREQQQLHTELPLPALAQSLGTFLQHQERPIHPSSPRPRGLAPSSPAHPGKRSTSFEYSFSTSSRPLRICHDTLTFSRFSAFNLGSGHRSKASLRWCDQQEQTLQPHRSLLTICPVTCVDILSQK